MKFSIIAFFSLVVSFTSSAQLDSINFTYSIETNPEFGEGLDSMALSSTVLRVNVFMNDYDFVGKSLVMIYDAATDTPIYISRKTREEILSETSANNGALVYDFLGLDMSVSYKIVLEVQNFEGAYLPRVTKTYLPNN